MTEQRGDVPMLAGMLQYELQRALTARQHAQIICERARELRWYLKQLRQQRGREPIETTADSDDHGWAQA